jgi:hypothetical protein
MAGGVHGIEQLRRLCIIQDAKKQTTICRPHEHAARRSQCDDAGAGAPRNVDFERIRSLSGSTAGNRIADRCGPRCKGENHAPQFATQATAGAKGVIPAGVSVSGVVFPIQRTKIRKPMHRETVLVPFALDIQLHQMLRKSLTGAFSLGTVGQGAVNAQRSLYGQGVHWNISLFE